MKKFIYLLGSFQLFAMRAYAQTGEDAVPGRDQGIWQTVIMIGIALVFFYLILWRPEQKRRKVLEDQRNTLKKGDRVTAMGIIGTVVRVQEHTVILKMFDGAKLEFLKGAITDVLPATDDETKKIENDKEVKKDISEED